MMMALTETLGFRVLALHFYGISLYWIYFICMDILDTFFLMSHNNDLFKFMHHGGSLYMQKNTSILLTCLFHPLLSHTFQSFLFVLKNHSQVYEQGTSVKYP